MKHNKKKTNKMIAWAVLITVFIILGGYVIKEELNRINDPITYEGQLDEILVTEEPMSFEEKIEALKNEVRGKIMQGESRGLVVDDGEMFFTFDPHNSILAECKSIGGKMNLDCLSFGPLQFKASTIIYYEKKINGNVVTEAEAIEIAHDVERASKLFDDIVYNEEGGIWNWSVAQHDKNYYSTVIPIIRDLIK